MIEKQPGVVEFDSYSTGAGTEGLRWKCDHLSVGSGLHTFDPVAADDIFEQTKSDLLAYWQTIATCDCAPPTAQPAQEG
jgi:hypothetical protein